MRRAFPVAATLLVAGAAFAQQPQPQPKPPHKGPDPNEVLCERQDDLGSRISAHEVCQTRAQWEEQRRQQHLDADKRETHEGCVTIQGNSC